jgi:hypothetical protein
MILLIIYHESEILKDKNQTILFYKHFIAMSEAVQTKTEYFKKNKRNYNLKFRYYDTK